MSDSTEQPETANLPALHIWAKEDGIFKTKPNVQSHFTNTRELIFDQVLSPGQECAPMDFSFC